MTYGQPDLYYQPEAFGLTPIGELDPCESYSFATLAVWLHEDGRIFYAVDAGCSCPSPFEDYTALENATEVTLGTWDEFAAEVAAHATAYYPASAVSDADRTELLAKVSKLLRQNAKKPPPG